MTRNLVRTHVRRLLFEASIRLLLGESASELIEDAAQAHEIGESIEPGVRS